MKKFWWIILLIALDACSQSSLETTVSQIIEATAVPPTPTHTHTPVPTATASPTITLTPTDTATPTITPTPTNTPTPELPVGLATAVPQPLHVLKPDNASQIVELARYGSGELLNVTHSVDGTSLIVVFTTGVYIYDLETFTPRLAVEAVISDDADNPYAISPDGSYLAVVSGDIVNVWNMDDGSLRHTFTLHEPPFSVYDLAFAPNGQSLTLVASLPSELTLWLWHMEDGAELLRQPGRKARFWPNGDLLITCCAKFSADAQLWQTSDGTLVGTLAGPPWPDSLSDMAFDPTGTQLAAVYKNSIWLWDVAERQIVQQFNRANGMGRGGELAFLDEGQAISMYSYEYDSLRLWDVAEGTLIADLPNQHSPIISPDHSRLLTQEFDRTTYSSATILWDVESGRELLRLANQMQAAFAAHGETIFIQGSRDNPTRLLQASDASMIQEFEDEGLSLVMPDGDMIATNSWEGIKFRSAVNGRIQHSIEGYFHHLLPDSQIIITWDNGRIMVWDASNGQQIHAADLPQPGIAYVWRESQSPTGLIPSAYLTFLQNVDSPQSAVSFSSDGRFRVVYNGREIEAWDVANYSGQGRYDILYTIPVSGNINKLHVSPDSQLIAAVQNDHQIVIWQAADGTPLLTLPPVPWIQDFQFSPDNQLLLATTSSDYSEALRVWELPSGNQILADSYSLEFQENGTIRYCFARPLALSPTGGLAAYSTDQCEIQIVQTSDWQVLQTIDPGFGRNGRMAFSPDGQLLATAFQGGVINLWDTASGELLYTLIDHNNPVNDEPTVQIAFSSDGKLLGTSGNGILHLWSIWP